MCSQCRNLITTPLSKDVLVISVVNVLEGLNNYWQQSAALVQGYSNQNTHFSKIVRLEENEQKKIQFVFFLLSKQTSFDEMRSAFQHLDQHFDLKIDCGFACLVSHAVFNQCQEQLPAQQFPPLSSNFRLLDGFPDELLLFIFQFLPFGNRIRLRRVSIRWSNILSDIAELSIRFSICFLKN